MARQARGTDQHDQDSLTLSNLAQDADDRGDPQLARYLDDAAASASTSRAHDTDPHTNPPRPRPGIPAGRGRTTSTTGRPTGPTAAPPAWPPPARSSIGITDGYLAAAPSTVGAVPSRPGSLLHGRPTGRRPAPAGATASVIRMHTLLP